jgi:hypothetical protein
MNLFALVCFFLLFFAKIVNTDQRGKIEGIKAAWEMKETKWQQIRSPEQIGAVNLSSTQSQLQFRSKRQTDGRRSQFGEPNHHTGAQNRLQIRLSG